MYTAERLKPGSSPALQGQIRGPWECGTSSPQLLFSLETPNVSFLLPGSKTHMETQSENNCTRRAAPLQCPHCCQPVPISPPSRAGTLVPPSPRPPRVPQRGHSPGSRALGAGAPLPTRCARFAHALWPRLSGSSRDGKDTTTHPPRDQCQREPEAVRGRGGSARRLAGNRQAPPAAPSRVAATDLGDSCCKQTPLDRGTWGIREEVEDLCGC